MSEKCFKFLLSELKNVRIRCHTCQAVVEIPIEQLHQRFSSGFCHVCQTSLQPPQSNGFYHLAEAIRKLVPLEEIVTVEFMIPDQS
jgi:hypothetical protein